jgi:hypothetical protein
MVFGTEDLAFEAEGMVFIMEVFPVPGHRIRHCMQLFYMMQPSWAGVPPGRMKVWDQSFNL